MKISIVFSDIEVKDIMYRDGNTHIEYTMGKFPGYLYSRMEGGILDLKDVYKLFEKEYRNGK